MLKQLLPEFFKPGTSLPQLGVDLDLAIKLRFAPQFGLQPLADSSWARMRLPRSAVSASVSPARGRSPKESMCRWSICS